MAFVGSALDVTLLEAFSSWVSVKLSITTPEPLLFLRCITPVKLNIDFVRGLEGMVRRYEDGSE